MKILHIIRSEPDDFVHSLIQNSFTGYEIEQVRLDQADVDYIELVQSIFESERVLCWW